MNRDELNALRSKPVDGEPDDEAAHFFVCKVCGQAVDMRRLGDVLYHEQPEHEALPVD